MPSPSLDGLIVKEQAKVIADLKREVELLSSGSGRASVHDYLTGEVVEPLLNPDDFLSDNTTFNFRLNAALKKEFGEICKRQHLTVGAALKRYMTDCVRSRSLN